MIRINGSGALYGEVWFDEEAPRHAAVDIVRYLRRHAAIGGVRCSPFTSLVTDLSVEAEAIAGEFGKACRYQVRRADTKDELAAEFITDPQNRIEEFGTFFDTFARQKGHEACNRQWLSAAINARQLVLSMASQGGEALVWHAYVISGKSTWLQYTGSCFRDRESDYRALVGRANRWLHWRDMLRFRELGVVRYDWGGMFQDESAPDRAGINEFKRSFGGQISRTYDCTVPVTLRGRIYLPLRDAWRNRRIVLPPRTANAASV